MRNAIFAVAIVPLLFAAALFPRSASGQTDGQDRMLKWMKGREVHYGDISRKIWEIAEVGYKEFRSVEILQADLRAAGFKIQSEIGGMPTSFSATWGKGKPVIGILGEYDALPALSQETVPQWKPRVEGEPGHGCGHNLFGAGSAFAAVAVKEFLSRNNLPGTIRFYGCPAEEGGGGKIYMVRAGVFKDCDAILVWHPSSYNGATIRNNLGNITGKFRYYGAAAHAAGSPTKGRSALDAVALATHGLELLREHIPQESRIHYIITHGGTAPNVVPNFAETYVYTRHPNMDILDGIWARALKCAEAGALATETRLEVKLVNSSYEILPNNTLAQLITRNLRRVGGVKYSAKELAFAKTLRKTFKGTPPSLDRAEKVRAPKKGQSYGSTDVGDVSWVVPTGYLRTACFVPGTPGHSWQSTACAGYSIGRKGMVVAAKTLALSAVELLTNPDEVRAARAQWDKDRKGREYRSRIPADQKPPLNYRD